MGLWSWEKEDGKAVQAHALILVLLSVCGLGRTCPSDCACNSSRYDCSGQDLRSLTALLDLLPPQTLSLTLSVNNLTSLEPGVFARFSVLTLLDLSQNRLTSLHLSTFSNLTDLEHLDLSGNLLEVLPDGLFGDLRRLTELDLSQNLLQDLSGTGSASGLFRPLTGLQKLDLSQNRLSRLPLGTLDTLLSLRRLSLARNKLSSLQRALLQPLTGLQALLLAGNPWNCSCSLLPLRHWLEWLNYRGGQVDAIECSLPESLWGRDLRAVPMEMFRPCYWLTFNPEEGYGQSVPCTRPTDSQSAAPEPAAECVRQRYRPVSVRRAVVTVAVAGVVCGIVCVMMVAAATYGCIYATLTAKQHQGALKSKNQQQQPLIEEKQREEEEEKELIPDTLARNQAKPTQWIVFPPEVCV